MAAVPANRRHLTVAVSPLGSLPVFRRMLLIGAALPILAMFLMSGMLALQIHQRAVDVAWTEHSDEVLKTADECLLYLTQMATIVRDYVIRGDPKSLDSYHQASVRAAGSLSALALLVRDNPSNSTASIPSASSKATLVGAMTKSFRTTT
jgi:CHASE3 domain sensor protein